MYPTRLYPQKSYKIINPPDGNEFLCRWVGADVELIDSTHNNQLSREAIEDERLAGMSTNKIPASEIEDCYLSFISKDLINKYTEEWKEGEDHLEVDSSHVLVDRTRKYFLIKISDIDGHSGKYPFQINNKASAVEYDFSVRIVHKPTKTNFFHFELEVTDNRTGQVVKKLDKGWKKIIAFDLKKKLCENAKFEIQDFNDDRAVPAK